MLLGDGIVYQHNDEYYVAGSADLSVLNVFEGIEEIIIWSRIYDIEAEETYKYSKYDFSTIRVPVKVMGVYNQQLGARGYLFTLFKRKKSLDFVFDRPCLVYSSMISVTQWMMLLLYGRRDIMYITRTIGDHEYISDSKYWYANIGGKIAMKLSEKHYKKAVLQTWVSKELENKYAVDSIPSVVFQDCQISMKDVVEKPEQRKENHFNLVFVGRLSPEKGIINILKAMKKSGDENLHLRIIGNGREEKHILSYIYDNKMQNQVELRGIKKWGSELFSEMKWAHCLVLPSYNEGLGMVCVEAMACGIPVIGSNVGGIPEIVKDYYNGILVEPGNIGQLEQAIISMKKDERLRLELAEHAIETAKGNTKESQQAIFKEAYAKYVYHRL